MTTRRTPPVQSLVRWAVASVSFAAVLGLFVMMDFGDRGYHFDAERTYAANVTADDGGGHELRRLRILQRCVGYVRSNYVEPDRADARAMVVAALDQIEHEVPELMADPVREGEEIAGIRVRVGEEQRVFDLSRVDDLYTINWKLLDIFEWISPRLSGDVDAREVEFAAVRGMLQTLDPHSMILVPRVYREMKLGTTGKFGGLGIVIGRREGRIVVQSVMEGTPAEGAGLRSGDRIVQINAESAIEMSLEDAVQRLRGPPGSPVDVWIRRRSLAEPKKYRIVRSNIVLASVTSKMLDEGIGYARVKSFQQSTGDDLRAAADRLLVQRRAAGHDRLVGFVLDLRDNPGGLLDQAIEVSDLFMKEGPIVSTVGAGARVREERVATSKGALHDVPLVVLVNRGSASASEIVAGALRNNDRALILGSRTFGKGSVQVIYDIDDAALKLTIAQYLTPGDESIQGVGITPHVQVAPITVTPDRVDLGGAGDGGENSLHNHLDNASRVRARRPNARVAHLADETQDFPLLFATELLTEAGDPSASQMLSRAAPLFGLTEREQSARLVEALAELDVDWHAGPLPARPRVEAKLVTDVRDDRVEAGRKVRLELVVTNLSDAPLHRVRAVTSSALHAFDGHDMVLGKIPSGETRRWKLVLDVPRSLTTQIVPVTATLFAGAATKPLVDSAPRVDLEVRGLPRPRFAYSAQILDVQGGNGDGVASEGEAVTVRIRVHNVGRGPAMKTLVRLGNRGGEEVFITQGRAWLEGLAPGEARSVDFQLEVREGVPASGLRLGVSIADTELRHRLHDRLDLPFRARPRHEVTRRVERMLVGPDGVRVHSAAAADSPEIGTLPAGTAVLTDALAGDMVRVPLEGSPDETEGFGWLPRAALTEETRGARVPQRARLQARVQVAQPHVELEGNVPLVVQTEMLDLSGDALFPTVRGASPDVYVMRDDDKVFFHRGTSGAPDVTVPFRAEIPLEPGLNKIAIYARAGRDLVYKREVTVLRR